MRHGRSLANEQDMIVSYPESGMLAEYGLSEVGRQQAEEAAKNSSLPSEVLIYTSDFSRARQTAEIVQRMVGASHVTPTELLRERNFGDLERTLTANYKKVWQADREAADRYNVEPLSSVLARTMRLIEAIEREYTGRDILLVSHGDTLQILQAGLQGLSLSRHRDLPQLETAEIRQLA